VKVGAVSGCFTATNSTDEPEGAWTKVGIPFDPPLDMSQCGALGVWVYGDGKGELLNFQLNNSRENYPAWDDHYVDVNFTGWRYFELLLRERDAQRHKDYVWPYGGPCEVGRNPIVHGRIGAFNVYYNNIPPGETVRCYIGPVRALPVAKTTLTNPTVTIGGKAFSFPVTLEGGQYIEYEGSGDCRMHDERGAVIAAVRPEGDAPVLAAGDNALSFAAEGTEGRLNRANVTVITQGEPMGGQAPAEKVDWELLRTEFDEPRTISAPGLAGSSWEVLCRPDARGARVEAEVAVQSAGAPAAGYDAETALPIETFDDLARFADTPENTFARYVYDAENSGIPCKPGVTQTLESVTKPVKVGGRSARLSATSTRGDNAGWCAKGARFSPPLDLSSCPALGFWLHGDGGGQSFKLQLRDTEGAWYDMVTPVDFTGWKYVQFDLGEGGIRLGQIEYAILFYNSIPGGATVSCCIDDIRGLRAAEYVRNPVLTIAGRRLVFPVSLAAGERLVYRGMDDCVLYGRDGAVKEQVSPVGTGFELHPGPNKVRFRVGPGSARQYVVRVSLTKVYPTT